MIMGRFGEAKKILDQWWQKGSLNLISNRNSATESPFSRTMPQRWNGLPAKSPADDMRWLGLQQQLAFFRGDFTNSVR
jgi:hypothetical protein